MKKQTVTILLMSMLMFIVFSSLYASELTTVSDRYTGSLYKGNYVWGGAMNLAWTELTGSVIHEKVKLNTADKQALSIADKLNNPVFTKRDLDEVSYYIKSGYGQKTVDTINLECRKKFPSKSFGDLKMKLSDTDIISYAYFLKEVKYEHDFEKTNMEFLGAQVEGFTGNSNVYILDYIDKDHFLIGIQLKDQADQIFLAKGYPMDKPDEIVARLSRKYTTDSSYPDRYGKMIQDGDVFESPMLHLDYTRNYEDMINKTLGNKQFSQFMIKAMQERIKFDMDEKGARVENEAYIVVGETAPPPNTKYEPKIMILDKPYWVVMVRSDSFNPYFILGVNHTNIMNLAK